MHIIRIITLSLIRENLTRGKETMIINKVQSSILIFDLSVKVTQITFNQNIIPIYLWTS